MAITFYIDTYYCTSTSTVVKIDIKKVISISKMTKRFLQTEFEQAFSSLVLRLSFDKEKKHQTKYEEPHLVAVHLSATVSLRFHLARANSSLYSQPLYVIRNHPSENCMCLPNLSPCTFLILMYALVCKIFFSLYPL